MDRDTGRPRGFAFVEFAERSAAEEAIQRFDRQPFKSRPLSVSEARPREERGPRPGGPPGPRPGPPGPRAPFTPRPAPGGARGPGGGEFGPPEAPRRQRAAPSKKQQQQKYDKGPRGPIPLKGGGRVYDFEDDPVEEIPDFDNFATSAGDEEEGGSEE